MKKVDPKESERLVTYFYHQCDIAAAAAKVKRKNILTFRKHSFTKPLPILREARRQVIATLLRSVWIHRVTGGVSIIDNYTLPPPWRQISCAEIAQLFQVGPSTIWRYLK